MNIPPEGAQSADRFTKFDYLLNAFEQASQAPEPAKLNYGDKRKALYAHVRELERRTALAAPEGPAPTEAEKDAAYALGRAHEREAVFAELRLELDHAKDQASGNGGSPRYDYYADCIEMLLSNFEDIAPEAPPPVEARQPLTRVLSEDQIEDAIDEANRAFTMRSRGPSGQQLTSYDSRDHWFARAIEARVRAALAAPAGAGEREALRSLVLRLRDLHGATQNTYGNEAIWDATVMLQKFANRAALDHQVGAPVTLSDAANGSRDTGAPNP